MDDRDVVEAFARGGEGAGPRLHVDGDVLLLSGWWHIAVRVADGVFIVREEEPPEPSEAIDNLPAALAAAGVVPVRAAHPLAQALSYTELTLVGPDWTLWGSDPEAAEAALAARVGAESVARDWSSDEPQPDAGDGVDFETPRRLAGLAPARLLVVGLTAETVAELRVALPECDLELRAFTELEPEDCGRLRPDAVVVDARQQDGRNFVLRLRAPACGRFLPVAAVTYDDTPPLGADVALDAAVSPGSWRAQLVPLLP